ncbi:hypothetical protein B0H10DRAFT_2246946 [Mycena sp. CBHHK59/15]|nr:hypothetical protein B0H10DRAFT_2246946 [Mycena sp. CBHHK59/15]
MDYRSDYRSGNSSPASSLYGESTQGSLDNYQKFPSTSEHWGVRSSSPVNSSGLMLPSSHRSSSSGNHIQNLESRVQKLEKENSFLRTKSDTIKLAYQELVNAVPGLIAITSNPFGLALPDGTDTPLGTTPVLPPFPAPIIHWSDSGCAPITGINTTGKYIEDTEGHMVSGYRLSSMYTVARRVWLLLLERGKAPPKWSQGSVEVVALYNNEMCQQFPELRLCADNWKAQQIATTNYPSWISSRAHDIPKPNDSKKKGKSRRRRSSSSSPIPPPPEQRKKIKLDTENLLVFNPLWDPPAAPDVVEDSPAPDTVLASEDALAPVPTSATPPSDVRAADGAGVPKTAATDNSVPPAGAATLSGSGAPTAALTPPEIDPAAAAAAHAALIASAFPPQTEMVPAPAPSVAAAATILTSTVPGGGGKMMATNSLTPRNLCAKEWIAKYHGLRSTFSAYWLSIVGTDEHTRWSDASDAAKKISAKNTALATA